MNMYNEQLEKLIELALIDGEITEKEKQVLFKKAESLGIDPDEFEMVLDAKLSKLIKENTTRVNAAKEVVQKCPSCGDIVSGLNRVCSACGFVFTKTSNNELENGVHSLENKLVELKSYPKPSVYKIIKPIILIYLTLGIYILYKKLYKKEHIFSADNTDFEKTIANTDKEIRTIKNSYGESPQVKKLLLEIGTEKDAIISERKKTKIISIGVTAGIFIIICLYNFLQPKPTYQRVEQLIEEGKLEEAKTVVNKLKSTDFSKDDLQTQIIQAEVEKLLESKKFDEALQSASLIKAEYARDHLIEKIIETEVDFLISSKEYKNAKVIAGKVTSEYKRNEILLKINNAEKLNK